LPGKFSLLQEQTSRPISSEHKNRPHWSFASVAAEAAPLNVDLWRLEKSRRLNP
jgi:hypothetical protein